jgi:hypothetical protein
MLPVGTNFPRLGMQRIRRVADAAAAASPRGIYPLLDVHTGSDPSPPAVSYAGHYPLMDYVWNGEGFDFTGSPAYWLVEVSSRIHGMSGPSKGPHHYEHTAVCKCVMHEAWSSPACVRGWPSSDDLVARSRHCSLRLLAAGDTLGNSFPFRGMLCECSRIVCTL